MIGPGKKRKETKPENPQRRIWWLMGVVAFLFIVLWGGLVVRQLFQYWHFRKLEERQSLRRVLLPAPRGVITDRNGVVLANNKPRFSLIVYLGELRGEFRTEQIRRVRLARAQGQEIDRNALQRGAMEAVLREHLKPIERFLNTKIDLDVAKIEKHLNQQPLMPYVLRNDLSINQFARLTELLRVDAPIQLQVQSLRTYPQGPLLSHVLGFVAMREPPSDDSDLRTFSFKEQVGLNGVEKSFDDTLGGTMGMELWLVNPAGFKFERTEQTSAKPGQPLRLTVDTRLQKALEKAFGRKIGAAAALDVGTGEVLALVSRPGYNPNDLIPSFDSKTNERINVHNGWMNRAIQGLYPPGSTFKLMTALAAIDAQKLTLDEKIGCPGYMEVGGRKYPCNNHAGHGNVNLVQALEKSCNVYFYTVGLRTGPDAVMAKAREYGLDKPTGIELPGETERMNLPTPAWKREKLFEPWYAGDTANVAIGQGDLLVTPLQMACMTASLARGDTHTPPTLIKKDHPAELPRKAAAEGLLRVIEGMKAAATTGTARLVRVEGLEIAAKTGTAQVKARGENLTLGWFVGFAPVENPQVAIAVVVEGTSPDDGYAGGTTAAPIARSFFAEWKSINQPTPPPAAPPTNTPATPVTADN